MDQPGIEVRPLKEMTGGATFNEVFLTEARVPHDNVIGDVNRGWGVAVTTLAHELNSLGASGMGGEGGSMIGSNDLERPTGTRSRGDGDMAGKAMSLGGGGTLIAARPALVGRSDAQVLRVKGMPISALLDTARSHRRRGRCTTQHLE